MKKISVTLYEITKQELKKLYPGTQVLVFNPYLYSYKVCRSENLFNYSGDTNFFFLFDKEDI